MWPAIGLTPRGCGGAMPSVFFLETGHAGWACLSAQDCFSLAAGSGKKVFAATQFFALLFIFSHLPVDRRHMGLPSVRQVPACVSLCGCVCFFIFLFLFFLLEISLSLFF
jgi:hypothetical protein